MSKKESRVIQSHSGLRGLAAFVVMLFHYLGSYGHEKPLDQIAWIAVDLFFMLSGFILCWVYYHPRQPVCWKSYLVARIARICPLYYITFCVASGLIVYSYSRHGFQYIGKHDYWGAFMANLFMLSGVLDLPTFNIPAWSISVEFFCYIVVFPLLIFTAKGKYMERKDGYQWMIILILVEALCVLGLRECIFHQNYKFHGWNPVWLLRGVFGFVAGFALCLLFKRLALRVVRHMSAVKMISTVSFSLVVLGIFKIIPAIMVIYFMPVMIISLAYDIGPVARLLSTKPVQTLGELSYGIYMWHMLILLTLQRKMDHCIDNFLSRYWYSEAISLGFFIIVILVVASVSYRLVEVPARRWIRSAAA